MQVNNRAPRILAIDDDADTLVGIGQALAGTGFALLTAGDGARGLEMALRHAPDLIISDITMPGMDGWTLVKRVRCAPGLALVPFIFLTDAAADEDRLRGFQLGADDFVTKPLRPGELSLRVQGSLQRQARIVGAVRHHLCAGGPLPGQIGIRGGLEHISRSALLTLLEMERKTGVLSLSRPEPPHQGALYVRDPDVRRQLQPILRAVSKWYVLVPILLVGILPMEIGFDDVSFVAPPPAADGR